MAIYKRKKEKNSSSTCSSVLFILNRLRPENFSCPLNEIQSVQLEGDLLMLLLHSSQVMGIWLFDETERQLALNVLQSLLTKVVDSEESDDESEQEQQASPQQMKPISVTDLLGTTSSSSSSSNSKKEKTPSILDLLAKAKIKDDATTATSPSLTSLEAAISDKFRDLPASTSLKSFTNSVCQFIQSNPQLLTTLHRDLINRNNKD